MRFTLGIILGATAAIITAPINLLGDLVDRLRWLHCDQCGRAVRTSEVVLATFHDFGGGKRRKLLCLGCLREIEKNVLGGGHG